jgi:hypothetical protein
MVSTFQALAVALLAILPGASYTFAYERAVGAFGVSLADRFVRFLAASAIFQALYSGPMLLLYRKFVHSGDLGRGEVNWVAFELVALAYVALPIMVGALVGHGQNEKWPIVLWLLGDAPEPRAWDFLWRKRKNGIVRLKLRSGSWVSGLYGTAKEGRRAYASGYPEEGDLYLSVQFRVDPATGAFDRDAEGQPRPVDGDSGLLVRWAEVEYLEFMEF